MTARAVVLRRRAERHDRGAQEGFRAHTGDRLAYQQEIGREVLADMTAAQRVVYAAARRVTVLAAQHGVVPTNHMTVEVNEDRREQVERNTVLLRAHVPVARWEESGVPPRAIAAQVRGWDVPVPHRRARHIRALIAAS